MYFGENGVVPCPNFFVSFPLAPGHETVAMSVVSFFYAISFLEIVTTLSELISPELTIFWFFEIASAKVLAEL